MSTIPCLGTATIMTTSTESGGIAPGDLYRLLAWFSPSYPIGAFSYSHGIEFAVETGRVKTASDLSGWIGHVLRHGAAWVDAVLLKEAYMAASQSEGGDAARCRTWPTSPPPGAARRKPRWKARSRAVPS